MTELLLQYTALPNLHPALVHFPIAALPFALGFEFLGFVLVKKQWLAHAATSLYAVAGVTAWIAASAGERAANGLAAVPAQVQTRIGEHSDWAHYALYSLLALAAMRVIVHFLPKATDHRGARLAMLLLGLTAFGVLGKAADLGGGLVYRYGVAIEASELDETDTAGPDEHADSSGTTEPSATGTAADDSAPGDPAANRLVRQDDGGFVWKPSATDREALGQVLTAAPGSDLEALSWVENDDGTGLTVEVDGSATLVFPGIFSDVQVEATFELLDDWKGTVGVAHHLQESQDGGSFAVSPDGSATLADIRASQRKVLDQKSTSLPESSFTVAVSSAGKHLKGLVDGKTVTHGHIEPGPAGACGLQLDGQGRLRILEARVIPLGKN